MGIFFFSLEALGGGGCWEIEEAWDSKKPENEGCFGGDGWVLNNAVVDWGLT